MVAGGDNNTWSNSYIITNGYGTTYSLYGFAKRGGLNTKITIPTLKCANKNDKFTVSSDIGNGALKYPIALITADELVYAGATGSINVNGSTKFIKNYYLYNNESYWTMTTQGFSNYYKRIFMIGMFDNGQLKQCNNVSFGIRPVITLKNNTKITGKGMQGEPYIIE